MSLWWTRREHLDAHQADLIENLPLRENHLVLGPPGSGKTNVLLRRAQFVRSQNMPNVMVLTFTRPLAEFVRTGCYDGQRQIFPPSLVSTIESWIRDLFEKHGEPRPKFPGNIKLSDKKRQLADAALALRSQNRFQPFDALFIDEAQDLMSEEVELFRQWSSVLFFVGDDRQKIFDESDGLTVVRPVIPNQNVKTLPFHYRLAPEICAVADRILLPEGGKTLASRSHYQGPTPGNVAHTDRPHTRQQQIDLAAGKLINQLRVYGDLINQGDILGIIVTRKDDRMLVFDRLQTFPELAGRVKVIRARDEGEADYDPAFDAEAPICIVTLAGCKGLEFRAVHWLFCDDYEGLRSDEQYYTVVTRAKTELDLYYSARLPQALARASSPQRNTSLWGES